MFAYHPYTKSNERNKPMFNTIPFAGLRIKNGYNFKKDKIFERRVGVPWSGVASRTELPSARSFTRSFLKLLIEKDTKEIETESLIEEFFLTTGLARACELFERLRSEAQGKTFAIADEIFYLPKIKREDEAVKKGGRIINAFFYNEKKEAAFILRIHLTNTYGKWKITAIEQGSNE